MEKLINILISETEWKRDLFSQFSLKERESYVKKQKLDKSNIEKHCWNFNHQFKFKLNLLNELFVLDLDYYDFTMHINTQTSWSMTWQVRPIFPLMWRMIPVFGIFLSSMLFLSDIKTFSFTAVVSPLACTRGYSRWDSENPFWFLILNYFFCFFSHWWRLFRYPGNCYM